jgi:hypothetical protein
MLAVRVERTDATHDVFEDIKRVHGGVVLCRLCCAFSSLSARMWSAQVNCKLDRSGLVKVEIARLSPFHGALVALHLVKIQAFPPGQAYARGDHRA